METSDGELLLLFQRQRSESAFRAIVERHRGLVFSICYRKLGDRHLAEDAAQNVFITLALKAAALEPGPLPGFLARTAMYISADIGRARAARARHERQYRNSRTEHYFETEPQDDRSLKLRKVLGQLRENYREPLLLRYHEGLSVEAVAVALQLSPEAVKKRIVRALAHVRQRMAAQGFSMSLAMAAGTLQELPVPTPPADLTGRIMDAVFHVPTPPTALRRVRPPHQPLVHVTGAVVGACTIATVAAVALMPRTRSLPVAAPQSPPPAKLIPAEPNGEDSRAAKLEFERRLTRKLPDLFNRDTRFDFALNSLSIMSRVPIEPRWKEIEALGISHGAQFSLDLRDKNLLQDVDTILEHVAPGALECVVAEGRIVVQPRSKRVDLQKTAVLDSRE